MRTDDELRNMIKRLQRQMAYFAARCQQFTSGLVAARHDLQVLTEKGKEKRAAAIERITRTLEPTPALAKFDARNASTHGLTCPVCANGAPCPPCYTQWYIAQEAERLEGEKALEEAIAADAREEAQAKAQVPAAANEDGEPHQDPANEPV
jgi:hypothetical protein